jgi:hypothetical protein
MKTRLLLIVVMLVSGLPLSVDAQQSTARPFEEAEKMFHQDPRWLGADGAHSTPLDENRIFWTFADTFIATSDAFDRRESEMVRNTVAIQRGRDPLTASMKFHWRQDTDGSPVSFYPESGESWYWPQASIRLDEGPLITFLSETVNTPGEGLGFRHIGYAMALVENPDAPVADWKPRITTQKENGLGFSRLAALVRDEAYVVALALKGNQHQGALVRYRAIDLSVGNLDSPQWWSGADKGWVPAQDLAPEGPEIIMDNAGSESSIHRDVRTKTFIHITTYGFGAADIGIRTAHELTGPWSEPFMIYRPPESDAARPFVYGAVAHPSLTGSHENDLVITYSTNSFDFFDLITQTELYWPRVIEVSLEPTE